MQNLQRSSVVSLAMLALTAAGPPALAQQQAGAPAARIELTTSSEKAKADYRMILPLSNNLRGTRARAYALSALSADPSFGLARIQAARLNPDLTNEQRTAEATRALADMTSASVPEVLFALFNRETFAGRTQSAQATLRALAEMVPGDPDVHFILLNSRRAGAPAAEALRLDREFIARFPDYAPGYNQHAYTLYTSGDKTAAFAAIANYVRLAPAEPNSHDTFGDLLVLEGRFDEAVAHSNAAIRLDSSWTQGYMKIGAIRLQAGFADSARTWFRRGMEKAPTPAAKADAYNWVATTYVIARDGRNALRMLDSVRAAAEAWNLPAATRALTHLRLALIEANLGSKQNVATHLGHAAQINGGTTLAQSLYSSIAYASIGDATQARAFADTYAATANAVPTTTRVLNALAAVTARDWARAEGELAQVTTPNTLAQQLRGEVLKAQGKKADAEAIRTEVLSRPVKADGAPGVDLYKVVARLRAMKM